MPVFLPPRAVVFDMDGTLFDSSEVVPAAFADTIRRLGGPTLSREEVIGSYVIGPPEPIMVHFLGRPVEPAELDAYHERLAGEAERRHLRPYPGIVEALDRLAMQVPIGVFTNADRGNATALLGATDLLARFAVVVGADEVAPNFKPRPDGLMLACERLEVDPARTAYVGDSPLDVEVAKGAGALAVAAGWGHLHEAAVEADVRVRRPTDLPPALALDAA